MVTSLHGTERRQAILVHIARYRFSIRPVIEKLFFNGKSCDNVLRAMAQDDLIIARPDSKEPRIGTLIPGGYKYYQLTLKTANSLSLPSSLTSPLGPGAIDKHLAVLWFCCMGESRLNLLEPHHLAQLFGEENEASSPIPDGPYCIELEGKHRVFKIFAPGAKSQDQYHIKQFRKHLEDATSHPELSRWIEIRRLAYVFLVSNDLRGKNLMKRLKDDGYKGVTYIHAVTVPTHQTLDAQLKSKPQPARKKACSRKSNAKN